MNLVFVITLSSSKNGVVDKNPKNVAYLNAFEEEQFFNAYLPILKSMTKLENFRVESPADIGIK